MLLSTLKLDRHKWLVEHISSIKLKVNILHTFMWRLMQQCSNAIWIRPTSKRVHIMSIAFDWTAAIFIWRHLILLADFRHFELLIIDRALHWFRSMVWNSFTSLYPLLCWSNLLKCSYTKSFRKYFKLKETKESTIYTKLQQIDKTCVPYSVAFSSFFFGGLKTNASGKFQLQMLTASILHCVRSVISMNCLVGEIEFCLKPFASHNIYSIICRFHFYCC